MISVCFHDAGAFIQLHINSDVKVSGSCNEKLLSLFFFCWVLEENNTLSIPDGQIFVHVAIDMDLL